LKFTCIRSCKAGLRKTIHYTSNIDYKENIIHAIQCTASHHTFTQQNSVNQTNLRNNEILYNMKCIIKSDAEHKRVRIWFSF
ncbi:hypothetical protein T11_4037, partial [Trichinella zimbabwensis]